MNHKILRSISILGRVVGVATILYGISIAMQGVYAYLIGAIPGIASIVIGVFLFKSGIAARRMLKNNDQEAEERYINDLLKYYSYFLYIVTGLFVVAIAFLIYFYIAADIDISQL